MNGWRRSWKGSPYSISPIVIPRRVYHLAPQSQAKHHTAAYCSTRCAATAGVTRATVRLYGFSWLFVARTLSTTYQHRALRSSIPAHGSSAFSPSTENRTCRGLPAKLIGPGGQFTPGSFTARRCFFPYLCRISRAVSIRTARSLPPFPASHRGSPSPHTPLPLLSTILPKPLHSRENLMKTSRGPSLQRGVTLPGTPGPFSINPSLVHLSD